MRKGLVDLAITDSISWMKDALCLEYPQVDFFPDNGDKKAIAKAKAVCRNCLVRDECLEWAYHTRQSDGIYSGFTVPEVRRVAPLLGMKSQLTRETPVSVNLNPIRTSSNSFILNVSLTGPKPFVLRVP